MAPLHPDILDEHPALAGALRGFLAAGSSFSEAEGSMARLAAETRSIPPRRMDRWERAIRAESSAAERARHDTSRTARPRPHPVSWLDLCSHDGRRREAALRTASGGAPSAFVLALALRRLNDWVPEVRRAARETLPALASGSDAQDVAEALWSQLVYATNWQRMQQADTGVVIAMAASDPVRLALRSRIMEAAAGPASLVLAQCVRSSAFDEWIQEFAQGAAQPVVRARALRWFLLGRIQWVVGWRWRWTDVAYCKGQHDPVLESRDIPRTQPFSTALGVAMADRSPVVRRVAAEFLIRELPSLGDDALAFAQRLAADRNPTVAQRGRFALQRLGREDTAAPSGAAQTRA